MPDVALPETTIYFDESGFTGTALLDPAQPYFCVASTSVREAEARDLLCSCFPRYKAKEFKLKDIWKRPSNRPGLTMLASKLPELADRCFIWMIDKRFCSLTKMVDYLIEPTFYEQGYDFYKAEFAPRFVNWFFEAIRLFGEPQLYTALTQVYERFARTPTAATLAELRQTYGLMARSVPEELRRFLEMAHHGSLEHLDDSDIGTFANSNEVQLTSVLSSVIAWRKRTEDDLIVVHDQSSNFFNQAALWETITSSDVEHQLHQLGDGSAVSFPLRVTKTVAMKSEYSHSVQLCDMISGIFSRALPLITGFEKDPFVIELIHAGLGEMSFDGILPRREFPKGSPPISDGTNIVDQMAKIIFKK